MKKGLWALLVLALLFASAYFYFSRQVGPYGKGGVVFFPKGSSVTQIAGQLEQQGLIRNAWSFKVLVRIKDAGGKLHAGEYEIKPDATETEIIDKLVKGERIIHKLLIPEGYTFQQIASAIEKAGIAPASQVTPYFRDAKLLANLDFPATSLEGYLFPATYEYDRTTSVEELLKKMISAFKQNYDASLREQTLQQGLSIPQVVTLASIIEKETGQAAERPLISSVFHNRLHMDMPLQSDPTVIYGLPHYDGNIHKADLSNPHPYNTYVHPGLPPGPIASPGKASLKAALNPSASSYLYFVAKGDGTHVFAATLEEHNANVQRYQLGGKAPESQNSPESKPSQPPPP